MIKITITTLLIFFCTLTYGQNTKIFEKDNISFKYPNNWVIRDFPGYYILVSEPPKEQISVMTTFDVVTETGYKTLNEFCKDYEDKMLTNEQFKDFNIKARNEIEFKELKAIEYHCTATVQYLPI